MMYLYKLVYRGNLWAIIQFFWMMVDNKRIIMLGGFVWMSIVVIVAEKTVALILIQSVRNLHTAVYSFVFIILLRFKMISSKVLRCD